MYLVPWCSFVEGNGDFHIKWQREFNPLTKFKVWISFNLVLHVKLKTLGILVLSADSAILIFLLLIIV